MLFFMSQLTGLGAEENDSDSDVDEPDIRHMPAVENPLNDLQYAELLLRYPRNLSMSPDNCKDIYIAVCQFVLSCQAAQTLFLLSAVVRLFLPALHS